MSEEPPNFRAVERNNCLKCLYSTISYGSWICRKYDEYKICTVDVIPTGNVCNDFEVAIDE